MQTHFTIDQLKDPAIAEANGILRACVHCGFCTATCPTYVLLGDELDSPRGRIYLIKDMLEQNAVPSAETVKHVDRCLSCLACMTTCPSGVNYMHLVDTARSYIEAHHRRPLADRLMRGLLGLLMPQPRLFELAMWPARVARPFAGLVKALGLPRLAAALNLVQAPAAPEPLGHPGTYPAEGARRGRVALLQGCVQSVTEPAINAATIRLLTRLGFEVIVTEGEPCCGSLNHHLGQEDAALARARAMVEQWSAAAPDAIIITASGCGTTIKDYGHMLRLDPAFAGKAARVSGLACDITEFLARLALPQQPAKGLRVAYHSACSMQHGQNIHAAPVALLQGAGFEVVAVPEGHLCCGSAGTYNMLQPALAGQLKARKQANIASTGPAVVATGNLGCMEQLRSGLNVPLVHTVELLDWAHGGPVPKRLAGALRKQLDGL